MCLGSLTLSGLLLVSNLSTLASTQTTTTRPLMKTMSEASTVITNGTYTEAVRIQMQWTTTVADTASLTEKQVRIESNSVPDVVLSKKTPQIKKSPANKEKSVQAAAASLKKVSRSDSSEVVEHALSLHGVPYVFGGSSRSGFDCSGLTQYIYRSSGITLPRTASGQFRVGSSVSRAELQSGDLVFFSTYAKGASHVGIYIGGGHFVSASNRGVSISSLDSGYYARRYIGARRP